MKKFLSLVLALVMVLSLGVTAGAVDFTDEAAITKTEAVGVLAGLGIINGYEAADGTYSFAPNGNITRGAAAKIICMIKLGTKVAGILSCETAPFKDVAKDSTFAPYIAYCASEGIVGGYADGTYKPGNPVTGYAFTKMLLNALGIKGDYEGANYGVNVALAAEAAELFKGMDADTVYGANCTREDACQLAFNALTYTATGAVTQYIVEKSGKEIYKGNDALTALALSSAKDCELKIGTSYDGSLGDKHFGLNDETTYDDFGRPSKTWNNGEKVGTKEYVEYASFPSTAKLTYTTGTTAGKIIAALGYTTTKAEVTLNIHEDSESVTATVSKANKNDKTDIGGGAKKNGVLIEVYDDGDEATEDTYDVFVINTYAFEFTDEKEIVKANAETGEAAYVTIKDAKAADKTFDTTAFKKGDVVLYTQNADEIVNVVKAASVTGKVTAEAGDASYMRVDGVQYKLSATNAAEIGKTAGYIYKDAEQYTYYLDTFGNVIYAIKGQGEKVATNYIFVAGIIVKAAATGDPVPGNDLFSSTTPTTAAQAQARVIDLATGEISVKNLGIVKSADGKKYHLAEKTGAIGAEITKDFEDRKVNGIFEYATLADGSIVLIDSSDKDDKAFTKVAEEVVNVEKKAAEIKNADKSATLYTATSATAMTTLDLTYKTSGEVSAAAVSKVTGIANFTTGKYDKAVVTAKDKVASSIVVVKEKKLEETVNYAIFNGMGEVTDNTMYSFYVKGALVEYAATVELGLKKGDVVNLKLTDGKIKEDHKAIEPAKSGEIVLVDTTFVQIDGVNYYFADSYVVYDADSKYAADTVAVEDLVKVFTNKDGKVDMIIIDNAD